LSAAPRLAAQNVRVERDHRTTLEVEHLEIQRGEVTVVLGPNGAGKSTLVQLLALLIEPSAGDIRFDGAPVREDLLGYRRRMATVFQEPLLLDTSVRANVESGMALRGVSRSIRKTRAGEWMGRFGVEKLETRSARTLSGGEAQRVSLARAFALEPEVLFLDEPFTALDAPTRSALAEDLHPHLRDPSRATIFVTHDRAEALRQADRVVVLMDGRVRQAGSPAEVFGSPVDEEVAHFVGVETIVSGRVSDVVQGVALVDVAGRAISGGSGVAAGDEVFVCLRPEDVVVETGPAEHAGTSARNHLPAHITGLTPWGPFLRVRLDAGFPLVSIITHQAREGLGLEPGSEVYASFKAAAVHLIKRSV
jgi:tungstate transport system ATP-binding protein